MGNVLILETDVESLKFLKTLPKYCDYNFIFTSNPGDAVNKIDSEDILVFVLPFEMKNYNVFDILFTVSLSNKKPLCILSSNADNIKELLFCLNSYSVFKLVMKPFLNIIDIKDAISDAIEFREKYGIISEDVVEKMLFLSKEVSYWEKHNKMIDLNYLRCYQDIYMKNRFYQNDKYTISKEDIFILNMFLQDIHGSFIDYTTRVDNKLFDIIFNIQQELNSSPFSKGKINISKEVLKLDFYKEKLILSLIVIWKYIYHSTNEFEVNIDISYENNYIVIKAKVKNEDLIKEKVLILKKETEYILSKLADEVSIGNDKSILFSAILLKLKESNEE